MAAQEAGLVISVCLVRGNVLLLLIASHISILCGVRCIKWYSPQKFLAHNNINEQGWRITGCSQTLFLLCHHYRQLRRNVYG